MFLDFLTIPSLCSQVPCAIFLRVFKRIVITSSVISMWHFLVFLPFGCSAQLIVNAILKRNNLNGRAEYLMNMESGFFSPVYCLFSSVFLFSKSAKVREYWWEKVRSWDMHCWSKAGWGTGPSAASAAAALCCRASVISSLEAACFPLWSGPPPLWVTASPPAAWSLILHSPGPPFCDGVVVVVLEKVTGKSEWIGKAT